MATDDANVLPEMQQLRKNWAFFHVPRNVAFRGHEQGRFNSLSASERRQQLLILLTELETLRQADYLVCTFSSNIGTLLQSIRNKPLETVVSFWMIHGLRGSYFTISCS